jgi:7-keto-8-aminopelargonate synthetase-like enzyme
MNNNNNWKRNTYLNGTFAGALLGLVGAYLFARAAEEDVDRNGGQPIKLQTGQLLSIMLAILAVIRQIAESGKSK